MKKTLLIFVLSLITGCAPTLSKFRASNPDAIFESNKGPQLLASCIYHEIQEVPVGRISVSEKEGSHYILLSSLYGSGFTGVKVAPIAEIKIMPNPSGGSIIEMRKWQFIKPTIADKILSSIQHCAS